MSRPLLLITATPLEGKPLKEALEDVATLEPPLGELYRGHLRGTPVYLAHLGIGKVNTAAGLALAIREVNPGGVVQFGIGGAFAGASLPVSALAVARCEVHLDSGVKTVTGWQGMETLGFPLLSGEPPYYNVFPTDPALSQTLAEATGAPLCRFGTAETVTGDVAEARILHERHQVSVESMEGAAAAQVCLALGVPFAEVRGISNLVGERDKHAWDIPGAVRAVNRALETFIKGYGASGSKPG